MVLPTPADIADQTAHIHDDRASTIVTSHIICITIAAIAICLRFISRRLGSVALKADDWTVVAAFVLEVGEVACGLLAVHEGGGKHAILLPNPRRFGQIVLATEVLYNPAIACVKISMLLLYNRIFPDQKFRYGLIAIGSFVIVYSTIVSFTAIFQCRPTAAAWDPYIEGAKCIDFGKEAIVFSIINAMTDVVIVVLPMPLLWRMQMERRRKVQVMAMFATSSVVLIASIYRIPKEAQLSLSDPSWSDVDAAVWSIVEICIGILGVSLPTYRRLFTWVLGEKHSRISNFFRSGDGSGVSRRSWYGKEHHGSREPMDGSQRLDSWRGRVHTGGRPDEFEILTQSPTNGGKFVEDCGT